MSRGKRWPYLGTILCAVKLGACACAGSGPRYLDTDEIRLRFADVRDQAVLLDAPGTTATNRWYANGRFVSEWRHGERHGRVTGRWYAKADQRCVLIDAAEDAVITEPRCGAISRQGEWLVSHNPDGSPHGRHIIEPLFSSP